MLTLNQVAYRWPNAAADCLRAISLELHDGEWLALTGDNGAGKSTLLRIMAGLLSPTFGSVTLNGEPIAQLKTVNAPPLSVYSFRKRKTRFSTAMWRKRSLLG